MKGTYYNFKVDDKVAVKQTDISYDGLGDITPDMIGVIKAFPPKVQKIKGPLYDNKDYFAYVEFDKTVTKSNHTYHYRGGIDLCNLRKVKT